jgi:hypothetical protein
MKRRPTILRRAACALSCALLLAGCALLSPLPSIPPRHPEEVQTGPVDCRECHEEGLTGTLKPYDAFRHTPVFVTRHGSYARRGQNLCSACHADSFCRSCHALRGGIAPDLMQGGRPDLMAPHRGDYLAQHPLDGRMDPGSCLRCHGKGNNRTCARCHK